MTENPSTEIDAKIAPLGDWRGETLAHLRALIRQAITDIEESIKWGKPINPAGVPVWSGPPLRRALGRAWPGSLHPCRGRTRLSPLKRCDKQFSVKRSTGANRLPKPAKERCTDIKTSVLHANNLVHPEQ